MSWPFVEDHLTFDEMLYEITPMQIKWSVDIAITLALTRLVPMTYIYIYIPKLNKYQCYKTQISLMINTVSEFYTN